MSEQKSWQEMVEEFHRKHGLAVGVAPYDDHKMDIIRGHLIAEELGELLLAVADRDILKIADALADLAYVVVGAAVVYGIPLDEVFREVHASNMTKAVQKDRDQRIRDKGPDYRPPNIMAAMGRGFARMEKEREANRADR